MERDSIKASFLVGGLLSVPQPLHRRRCCARVGAADSF
jgi:hypothetical protein